MLGIVALLRKFFVDKSGEAEVLRNCWLLAWASETEREFIPPGQPWRNGFIESFNGKLRDECLSINQFYSLGHAKGIIGLWKEEYNTIRPHSSLGNKTPSVYAGQCTH